jgi:hypothetical protein
MAAGHGYSGNAAAAHLGSNDNVGCRVDDDCDDNDSGTRPLCMTGENNGSNGRDAITCKARLLLPRAPTIRRNDITVEERNGMIRMVY